MYSFLLKVNLEKICYKVKHFIVSGAIIFLPILDLLKIE